MGSFTKWLGAGLGFTFGGPIGAAIGFALGSVVDGFSVDDLTKEKDQYTHTSGRQHINTQSGDFEMSLLVLASIVIKADGKIDQSELDFVRIHFVKMYGKQRANSAFKLFKGIVNKKVSSRQVCLQIRQNMAHASRLQLIHFLFGIAKADGFVSPSEEQAIRKIASYLYINQRNYESIKAMFYKATDYAYKILEITKDATDAEVKKAYRRMAKKYHPDRVQGLGREHEDGAKRKFQSIQEAYEKIQKERKL